MAAHAIAAPTGRSHRERAEAEERRSRLTSACQRGQTASDREAIEKQKIDGTAMRDDPNPTLGKAPAGETPDRFAVRSTKANDLRNRAGMRRLRAPQGTSANENARKALKLLDPAKGSRRKCRFSKFFRRQAFDIERFAQIKIWNRLEI